jgi:3-hydroxybutyryl-CoA dehydrogenase
MVADSTRTVAVIGAGTMGAGIAGLFARAGCAVRLVDRTPELLARGMAALQSAHESLVIAGRQSRTEAGAAEARIRTMVGLEEGVDGIDLLVEAAPEDLALKQDLFARAERAAPADALFASNTSGLSITRIADALQRPEAFAGMHFWNPPHVVPLVEVVRGERTSDGTVETLAALARRLGKRPVVVNRDVPGFVGNRLQFAVFREALSLLENGIATAEDIDIAMTAGPGLRYGLLGPLRTADLGGLDVFYAISRYLFPELDSARGPSEDFHRLVKSGALGAKSGRGFYDYPGTDAATMAAGRDRVLLAFLDALEKERGQGERKDDSG